jgi:hypothetical protein
MSRPMHIKVFSKNEGFFLEEPIYILDGGASSQEWSLLVLFMRGRRLVSRTCSSSLEAKGAREALASLPPSYLGFFF